MGREVFVDVTERVEELRGNHLSNTTCLTQIMIYVYICILLLLLLLLLLPPTPTTTTTTTDDDNNHNNNNDGKTTNTTCLTQRFLFKSGEQFGESW